MSVSAASLRDQPVGDFLRRLASASPSPGGGGSAALTAAVAAGLTAMTARLSGSQVDDSEACAATMDRIRDELVRLADDDAAAYADVLATIRDTADTSSEERSERRGSALRVASEIPLAVANHAADVAEVGARLARTGNPRLRGDARTAVHLAHAAATSAAELVAINVQQGALDAALADRAREAAARARGAVADG